MTLFLMFFLIALIISIKASHYRLLCNELFWLVLFWTLIIGVNITGNVQYKNYGFSFQLFAFIAASFCSFLMGRHYGKRKRVGLFYKETNKTKTKWYILLGIFGVILFVYDFVRLNGLTFLLDESFNKESSYDISFIGSFGSLLIPVLLVEGLYLFSLRFKEGSFSIGAILLLLMYSIPCILNSGRESLLFIIIGLLVIWGYNKAYVSTIKSWRLKKKPSKILQCSIVVGVIIISWMIIEISKSRFGLNEINVFLEKNNVPNSIIEEAELWGKFDFLFYNIISYFSHQIAFLDFLTKEYDGPYMYGMFNFNIISRRLPDFMNLDYKMAFVSLNRLYSTKGVSFSGGWCTVLGSLLIDYGIIGTLIFNYICGFFVGVVRKKFELTKDVRYVVFISLCCLSCFASIQLGPFYQTLIWGSYLWWFIIFHKDEKFSKLT